MSVHEDDEDLFGSLSANGDAAAADDVFSAGEDPADPFDPLSGGEGEGAADQFDLLSAGEGEDAADPFDLLPADEEADHFDLSSDEVGEDAAGANPFDAAAPVEQEAFDVGPCGADDDLFDLDDVVQPAEPQSKSKSELPALVNFVNEFVSTRRSEQVMDASGHVEFHPKFMRNMITPEGAQKAAFSLTDQTNRKTSFGTTSGAHTDLDLKALVFSALSDAQSKGWDKTASDIAKKGDYLIVEKAWDETPQRVSFSKATHETLVSWGLRSLVARKNLTPQRREQLQRELYSHGVGTVQALVQNVKARWGPSPSDRLTFHTPPAILERTSAACILDGMDACLDSFDIAHLKHLASIYSWLVLCLNADGASSNKLVEKRMRADLEPFGILIFAVVCFIHTLYGCVRLILGYGDHCGPLHCAGHLLVIREYHTRLIIALAEELIEDMGFHIVTQAELDAARHDDGGLQALLDRTLHRKDQYHNVLGSLLREELHDERAAQRPAEQSLAARIKRIFTVLGKQGKHLCLGTDCCPDGRWSCILSAIGLIREFLLEDLPKPLALSKWHSAAENVNWWDKAHSLNKYVPRAWLRAFPLADLNLEANGDREDSYQVICTKRLRSVGAWIEKEGTGNNISTLNIISIPIDSMIYLLDTEVDEEKLEQPLVCAMLSEGGPLQRMQKMFADMIFSGGMLRDYLSCAAVQHSEDDDEQLAWFADHAWDALLQLLAVAARVELKVGIPCSEDPLDMFRMVGKDGGDVQGRCERFWRRHDCCRGRVSLHIYERLRMSGGSEQLRKKPFVDMLLQAAWSMPLAIGHIERRHRRNAFNVKPLQGMPRSVDRFVMDSMLQDWLREHVSNGGRDPNMIDKTTLDEVGMCKKKKKCIRKTGGSPQQHFINMKTRGRKLGTGQQALEVRRRLKAQYDALSQEAKQVYVDSWHRSQQGSRNASDTESATQEFKPVWKCGTRLWPYEPQALQSYANAKAGAMSRTDAGLTVVGRRLRQSLVNDRLVPHRHLEKPEASLSCWETHPGLCKSRDKEILDIGFAVSARFNALLASQKAGDVLGSVWRLTGWDVDDQPLHVEYVLTAFMQYSPRLGVFLALQHDAILASMDEEGGEGEHGQPQIPLWLATLRVLRFLTTYALAREMLVSPPSMPEKITVRLLLSQLQPWSSTLLWCHESAALPELVLHGADALPKTIPNRKRQRTGDLFDDAIRESKTEKAFAARKRKQGGQGDAQRAREDGDREKDVAGHDEADVESDSSHSSSAFSDEDNDFLSDAMKSYKKMKSLAPSKATFDPKVVAKTLEKVKALVAAAASPVPEPGSKPKAVAVVEAPAVEAPTPSGAVAVGAAVAGEVAGASGSASASASSSSGSAAAAGSAIAAGGAAVAAGSADAVGVVGGAAGPIHRAPHLRGGTPPHLQALIPDCARIFENLTRKFYKGYYPKEAAALVGLDRVRSIERHRSWGGSGKASRSQDQALKEIVEEIWFLHVDRTGDRTGWPVHLLGPVPAAA